MILHLFPSFFTGHLNIDISLTFPETYNLVGLLILILYQLSSVFTYLSVHSFYDIRYQKLYSLWKNWVTSFFHLQNSLPPDLKENSIQGLDQRNIPMSTFSTHIKLCFLCVSTLLFLYIFIPGDNIFFQLN